MSKWIELTRKDGAKMLIAIDKIVRVEAIQSSVVSEARTSVYFADEGLTVRDAYDNVKLRLCGSPPEDRSVAYDTRRELARAEQTIIVHESQLKRQAVMIDGFRYAPLWKRLWMAIKGEL